MDLALVVAFLVYSGYREWLFNARIKDLEIKLIAKNAHEYRSYKEADQPAKVVDDDQEPEELIDVFDASPEDFLKGRA